LGIGYGAAEMTFPSACTNASIGSNIGFICLAIPANGLPLESLYKASEGFRGDIHLFAYRKA
jgi:hypothetical protein